MDLDNRHDDTEHDNRDDNINNDDNQYGDNEHSSTGNNNQHVISTNPKIVEMLDKMSPKLVELLKSNGVTIQIDLSIPTPGEYNNSNIISLQDYDLNILYKEYVHAIQDSLGILYDENRFNNEFQEHIIGDILRGGNGGCLTRKREVIWIMICGFLV